METTYDEKKASLVSFEYHLFTNKKINEFFFFFNFKLSFKIEPMCIHFYFQAKPEVCI